MKNYLFFILLLTIHFSTWVLPASAQSDKKDLSSNTLFSKDSIIKDTDTLKKSPLKVRDSLSKHIPRIATRRSAILPGWGQAYNHEYWKIPIVYGILAIPITLFFYNDSYYKKTKFAFEARFKQANGDTSDVAAIDPELVNLGIVSLQTYRNAFRKNRDYSILWFFLAWGLQVADATVFAHLNQFDVSNDLTMQVKPQFNPLSMSTGLTLSFNFKAPVHKPFISR